MRSNITRRLSRLVAPLANSRRYWICCYTTKPSSSWHNYYTNFRHKPTLSFIINGIPRMSSKMFRGTLLRVACSKLRGHPSKTSGQWEGGGEPMWSAVNWTSTQAFFCVCGRPVGFDSSGIWTLDSKVEGSNPTRTSWLHIWAELFNITAPVPMANIQKLFLEFGWFCAHTCTCLSVQFKKWVSSCWGAANPGRVNTRVTMASTEDINGGKHTSRFLYLH